MILSDKIYNILKWITQYLLPAGGTLYFALSQIWGLPYGEEIIGTVVAVDIFLSTILGIAKHNYDKAYPTIEDGADSGTDGND